uniref:Uncharacterized protein n=1 Tax=Chromera velia CCMP2878 TaxID=1169474 RepID=A0A0G4FUW1_9ALVE|eukprot:Cvel_18818.t1-p1 / transcript=Cvel_18818.t1 / gene=Cvel_18818 / organism=Chromera_velia_CCMP2878 / gene_product=hypothetical protein / transcript_product=hypothetical protein / location=Cvel_scaffold1580:27445-32627(+) / protein_length=911 / sequence_SO=supercontig / SO=protein_coding / is_pseudo=false
MSRSVPRLESSHPEGHLQGAGAESTQTSDNVLCALFGHARPSAEMISGIASERSGFGLAWVLLEFIKTGRSQLPFESFGLSGFSLGAPKLRCLLSALPWGPAILQTLTLGPHVCKDACLPVLLDFLLRLKTEERLGRQAICLKTLNLSKCDLDDRVDVMFPLFPLSVEHLDLSGNRFQAPTMKILSSVITHDLLSNILSLDLSDNPLGPSGVKTIAKALSSSTKTLPLQSLKLARVKAKAEGMEALAKALKAKKTTSLQTLDLAENEMRPPGLKHLVSAINAEALPHLRLLILKKNALSLVTPGQLERDFTSIIDLLSTCALQEIEEMNLSENELFGPILGVGASAAAVAVPGRFPNLQRLNMKGTMLTSQQLAAFATALGVEGAPSLEELILPWGRSEETPEGVVALANTICSGHLSRLTTFMVKRIDRYHVTGEGFAALCRSLASGKTPLLQTLDLETVSNDAAGCVGGLAQAMRERRLPSLENFRLDIAGDNTDGSVLAEVGEALGGGGCPLIQKLNLQWEETGDMGLRALAVGLGGGNLSSLRDLSLEIECGGEGDGSGFVTLGKVLSTGKLKSLRRVSLSLGSDANVCSFCEGFSQGGGLSPPVQVEIEIAASGMANPAVSALADVIRAGKLSGLRRLYLDIFVGYNQLGQVGGERFGEALASAQANGSRRDAVSTEGVLSLSTLLTRGRFPALRDLNVNIARVGQEGMQAFAAALSSPAASVLRKLELGFSQATDAGNAMQISMLAVALSSGNLSRLEELCVSALERVADARTLFVGLGSGKLSSLHTLHVRRSRLGPEGGSALSEAVVAEKLPSLKRLDVSGGKMTDGGVRALSEAWMNRTPPPLQCVNLSDNSLTGAITSALLALFGSRQLTALHNLNLSSNAEFDNESKGLLSAAFADIVEL